MNRQMNRDLKLLPRQPAQFAPKVLELRLITGLLLGVILQAGCGHACHRIDFAHFKRADRIVVNVNSDEVVRAITQPEKISHVVEFAQAHLDRWKTPLAGTPIGTYLIEFYAGTKFLGSFGVGKTFMTTAGCGGFVSRSISKEERRKILSLSDVPDL